MASLTAYINLVDKFSPKMRNMTSASEKFSNTVSRIGRLVAGAFGTAVIGKFAKDSFNAFSNFQGKMNEVFTLLPGISGKAMDDMSAQTKKFAKDFGVLPDKLVPALYQSISAGVPKENVFKFLEVAQKAAVGGVTELETAVDGITSVVNAYGSDVISASKASDLMFTAVKNGKTDFNQLSKSLFNVIPTASALGVKFGDVTAALASMTAQGTPTSVATTQLRQLFVELSKEGTKTSKTFKNISGKSFKDFIASGGNVQDALKLMEKAAKKNNVGINDLFGSVEAGNAALALTGKGAEGFTKNLKDMSNAAGATDAAYAKMEKGVGRTIEKIKANMEVLKINIGAKILPIVQKATDFIITIMPSVQDAIDGFTTYIAPKLKEIGTLVKEIAEVYFGNLEQSSGSLKDTIVTLADVGFSAVKTGLEWIRDNSGIVKAGIIGLTAVWAIQKGILLGLAVAQGIHTAATWASTLADKAETAAIIALYAKDYLLAGATKVATAAQWLFNAALSANPISLVIIAIAALVAGLIYLYKNNETVRNAINAAWQWLKTNVIGAITAIKDWAISAWEAIKSFVVPIVETIASFISTAWEGIKTATAFVWEVVKAIFISVWTIISSIVQTYINIVTAVVSVAWEFIKSVTTTVWNAISSFFITIWNGIVAFFTPIINVIVSVLTNAWNTIMSITTSVWNVISTFLSTIWNYIVTLITTVVQGWINIFTTAWNIIKTVATTVWNGIVSFFTYIWSIISSVFTTAVSAISSVISTVWSTIQAVTSTVWNTISGIISGIVNGISSVISGVWNTIKNVTTSVWNGIKTAIMTPIKAAVDFVKGQIDKIKNFFGGLKLKLPHIKLPHFKIKGEFSLKPPSIPHIGVDWYAKGTNNAKRGPAVVGEKGPELLWMSGGEKVLPNNKTAALLKTPDNLSPEKAKEVRSTGLDNNSGGAGDKSISIGSLIGEVIVNNEGDFKTLMAKIEEYLREELFTGGDGVYES